MITIYGIALLKMPKRAEKLQKCLPFKYFSIGTGEKGGKLLVKVPFVLLNY